MIAVKDLDVAGRFYESVLGPEKLDSPEEEVLLFRSGSSTLNVYRSPFAGTNKATSVVWTVGHELEAIVAHLKERGVTFEHYDLPAGHAAMMRK